MGKRDTPEDQEARIDAKARQIFEDFLDGKAALIIEPIDGMTDVGERHDVGPLSVTLLRASPSACGRRADPAAMICRQSDHAYRPPLETMGWGCTKCGGAPPPAGPFLWTIEDIEADRTLTGEATCEKGVKCAASRALGRIDPGQDWRPYRGAGRLRPGVFASIEAPDGRRWKGVPNCIGYPDWELVTAPPAP